jgi:hypothetical protein
VTNHIGKLGTTWLAGDMKIFCQKRKRTPMKEFKNLHKKIMLGEHTLLNFIFILFFFSQQFFCPTITSSLTTKTMRSPGGGSGWN